MHNLVHLTGEFSVDQLKEVVLRVEILANLPLLEVHVMYADKNPKFNYREIFVSKGVRIDNKVEYHVMDMGRVKNAAEIVSLGDRIYLEEEIGKLK